MFLQSVKQLFSRFFHSNEEDNDLSMTFDIEANLQTDVGCCREINEDCIRYIQPGDADVLARKGRLAVVADGMGGHAGGEEASHLAVDVLSQVYFENSNPPPVALTQALNEANDWIYRRASENAALKGMGTTCTALVLRGGSAYWAHVGDSRLYLIRQDSITMQTEDHSIVTAMVKDGLIKAEEARNHPNKNVILRALGTSPKVNIDITKKPFPLEAGDIFILCSDGLSDLVEKEEIRQFASQDDLQKACIELIALAKERGGYDNISVGIIRVKAAAGNNSIDRSIPVTLPG